jgi:hypothetical protein
VALISKRRRRELQVIGFPTAEFTDPPFFGMTRKSHYEFGQFFITRVKKQLKPPVIEKEKERRASTLSLLSNSFYLLA